MNPFVCEYVFMYIVLDHVIRCVLFLNGILNTRGQMCYIHANDPKCAFCSTKNKWDKAQIIKTKPN